VTSVLQTTAGKMIFGKWDERGTSRHDSKATPPPVAAPAVATGTGSDPAKKPAAADRAAD